MNYTKEGILLQSYSCGCYVAQWGDSSCGIEYCPKHKAAPELYEALKAIDYIWRNNTPAFKGQKEDAKELLLKALAKVEGR